MKKLSCIIICVLFIFISCGEPPEDAKTYKILYIIQDILNKLNEVKDKSDEEKKFSTLLKDFNDIIAVNNDISVIIKSYEASGKTDAIAHTIDNNQFVLNIPLYVTFQPKPTLIPIGSSSELLISKDSKRWYSTSGDAHNIDTDYFFKTKIDENNKSITINYQTAFKFKDELTEIKLMKSKKEMVILKKGMVFISPDDDNVTVDLEDKILYLPKGTVLSGKIKLDGNLVTSDNKKDSITINFIKNIYIYLRNKMISLSFDKKNWNISILSFKISPKIEISSIEKDQIHFNFALEAIYKKDK